MKTAVISGSASLADAGKQDTHTNTALRFSPEWESQKRQVLLAE